MMRRSFFRLFADRDGVGALEFALVAIPFLLLTFGAIEFGRLIWIREALQETANQGARCMGVRAPSCASNGVYSGPKATSYIQNVASGWVITLTSEQIGLSDGDKPASPACAGLSEVSISYSFQTAVPGLLTMLSNGPSLTGHACFPHQS